jgi:hypothetical protein
MSRPVPSADAVASSVPPPRQDDGVVFTEILRRCRETANGGNKQGSMSAPSHPPHPPDEEMTPLASAAETPRDEARRRVVEVDIPGAPSDILADGGSGEREGGEGSEGEGEGDAEEEEEEEGGEAEGGRLEEFMRQQREEMEKLKDMARQLLEQVREGGRAQSLPTSPCVTIMWPIFPDNGCYRVGLYCAGGVSLWAASCVACGSIGNLWSGVWDWPTSRSC